MADKCVTPGAGCSAARLVPCCRGKDLVFVYTSSLKEIVWRRWFSTLCPSERWRWCLLFLLYFTPGALLVSTSFIAERRAQSLPTRGLVSDTIRHFLKGRSLSVSISKNQLRVSALAAPGKSCSLHFSCPARWKAGGRAFGEWKLSSLEVVSLLSLVLLLVIFGLHVAFTQFFSSQSTFNLRHLLLAQLCAYNFICTTKELLINKAKTLEKEEVQNPVVKFQIFEFCSLSNLLSLLKIVAV